MSICKQSFYYYKWERTWHVLGVTRRCNLTTRGRKRVVSYPASRPSQTRGVYSTSQTSNSPTLASTLVPAVGDTVARQRAVSPYLSLVSHQCHMWLTPLWVISRVSQNRVDKQGCFVFVSTRGHVITSYSCNPLMPQNLMHKIL